GARTRHRALRATHARAAPRENPSRERWRDESRAVTRAGVAVLGGAQLDRVGGRARTQSAGRSACDPRHRAVVSALSLAFAHRYVSTDILSARLYRSSGPNLDPDHRTRTQQLYSGRA